MGHQLPHHSQENLLKRSTSFPSYFLRSDYIDQVLRRSNNSVHEELGPVPPATGGTGPLVLEMGSPVLQHIVNINGGSSSLAGNDASSSQGYLQPKDFTSSHNLLMGNDSSSRGNLQPAEDICRRHKYAPLYTAALKGDSHGAEIFLKVNPGAVRAKIGKGGETALHIAAGAGNVAVVEKLVELMEAKDLEIKNDRNNTALCFAVASGIKRTVEVMVMKNRGLLRIRGSGGATPLQTALMLSHREMVWYLHTETERENIDLSDDDWVNFLTAAITSDLYDVALDFLSHKPKLATMRDKNGETALHVLARKPSAFASGTTLRTWQSILYSCIQVKLESPVPNLPSACRKATLRGNVLDLFVPGMKAIRAKKLMHIQALELVKQIWKYVLDETHDHEVDIDEMLRTPFRILFTAAELGIVEFVKELISSYPDLIWKVNDDKHSVFHTAVIHRQPDVFNLIHGIGALKDLIAAYTDNTGTNMLHLAAKLANPSQLNKVPGAALQMQRELLWLKEVGDIVRPSYKEMKGCIRADPGEQNQDLKPRTPASLFRVEHAELVREGEKWMKETADSSMLVATLIATVVFAALFTVPGGNQNDTGIPFFQKEIAFLVFSVSDSLALLTSSTSILTFLSIRTSRYAQEDFLESLPNRLIIGLTTLFISIITMLIAFSATLFIVLGNHLARVAIPLVSLAIVPVTLFVFLQFPLFADIFRSTYRSKISYKKHTRLFR